MSKKVLIIEDAKDLLTLYTKFLRDAGCELITATSALEALKYLETGKPDLIVMDLTFPDMSTMDFYEQIAANPALDSITKILVSGRDDLTTWVDVFNAIKGLRKPVQRDVFYKAVTDGLREL